MYFSLRLHMLPRLPVLPELPGQRMRVTQVVRRPPSEPTNGRPCSLLHHLGLVSLVPLVPLVPDVGPGGGVGVSAFSPPPPLASLSALSLPSRSEHVKVIADTTVRERPPPIYPMALATVAAIADGDTPCVATRLDNSSVHGPRLRPPLPAWRPRRRQATPPQYGWVHSRSRCSLMDIALFSRTSHTVARSSDAPSSRNRRTLFVSGSISANASSHLTILIMLRACLRSSMPTRCVIAPGVSPVCLARKSC